MNDKRELDLIRTLLALERNYLAVERTQLAQLRTGLTIALIAPPAATAFAYLFTFFPRPFSLDLFTYIFLTFVTIFGIYTTYNAYTGLKRTRNIQDKIRRQEIEIIETSEVAKLCFGNVLTKGKT